MKKGKGEDPDFAAVWSLALHVPCGRRWPGVRLSPGMTPSVLPSVSPDMFTAVWGT